MDSLLLFLEFGEVEGSFKLSLGVTSDTAACSLTFKDNRLTAEGLVDESGGNTAVLERGLLSGSTLKVEMIGGYVEISIRNAQDPYDYLGSPVATFYFEEGKTPRRETSLFPSRKKRDDRDGKSLFFGRKYSHRHGGLRSAERGRFERFFGVVLGRLRKCGRHFGGTCRFGRGCGDCFEKGRSS